MVLLQYINMQKSGGSSKRKRKLAYDGSENRLVVNCFDTPKKLSPKRREHRLSAGYHGNRDWDRRMEGFEGVATAKEMQGRKTVDECTPVDIDWASDDESEDNGTETVSLSQAWKTDILHRRTSTANPCPSTEWIGLPSMSIPRARTGAKTASMRKAAGGQRRSEPVSSRRQSNTAGESTQQDFLDVSISDYDSGSGEEDDESVTDHQDFIGNDISQSPDIPSLTPSMSPQSDSAANRSKISDWVKCLQWQDATPEKQTDAMEESNVADSTKKKPKYIRHGLADQLQRLIAREKSAVAFWLHKLTTARTTTTTTSPAATTESQESKVLSVRVQKTRKDCSLLVADCRYLASTSEQGDDDDIVVLFSGSCKVSPGCSVRIHPPWQSLETGGRRVILCTNFHEILSHEEPPVTQQNPSVTLLATWRCPCEQDRSLAPSACPAAEFPCSTTATAYKSAVGGDVCGPAAPSTHPTDHKLVLVSAREVTGSPSLSILDSVEKQGGGAAGNVGFTATVQRVFTHRTDPHVDAAGISASGAVSSSLLVQDSYGAMCHIEVTDRLAEKDAWTEILDSGEGRVYTFTGLRLVRRSSRNRSAGLFTVIDAIWAGTAAIRRQDVSQSSSLGSEPITFTEPPGFCYHLAAVWPDSVCRLASATPPSPSLYSHVRPTPLAALDGGQCRVTVLGGVVCHTNDISPLSTIDIHSVIYVTDASYVDSEDTQEKRYLCVMVKQKCRLPQDSWSLTSRGPSVVVFKDILSHQPGRCYFDPYSRVYDATSDHTLAQFSLTADDVTAVAMATFDPPLMTLDVRMYDLVTLRGRITSVDESTAYSWLECDLCHGDKVVEETNSRQDPWCRDCERSVEHPIARVNMDVGVSCIQQGDAVVKVKLLQPTIEMLLPQSTDNEGYDVTSVLQQELGPLTCYVVSATKRTDSCHFVLQELTTK